MSRPVKIFCSYSHADEKARQRLDKHLALLKKDKLIEVWNDHLIAAGAEWDEEIRKNLRSADIVLLLVSQDLLASNYCDTVEIKEALERHKSKSACVIPIYYKDSDWSNSPIAKLQGVPDPSKPISTWPKPEKAWTAVAKKIREKINQLQGSSDRTSSPEQPSLTTQFQLPVLEFHGQGVRDRLAYNVSLHDAPQSGTNFFIASQADRYIFFRSELTYSRATDQFADEIRVAAIRDLSEYSASLNRSDLLYGEVICVDAQDEPKWQNIVGQIKKAKTPKEKAQLLSQVMKLEVRLNDKPLKLVDFKGETYGYSLSYKRAAGVRFGDVATFDFVCESFQPRSLAHFPFVISELSRNVDFRLDYSDLTTPDAQFFSAFLYHRESNPIITKDPRNRILEVKSRPDQWMYPGGGIVLHWR